jgi:hypothetical protein
MFMQNSSQPDDPPSLLIPAHKYRSVLILRPQTRHRK